MATSDGTLRTVPVCDMPTNLPHDPGLDADATLDKVELPTIYADLYGTVRERRRGEVEVYAGTMAIDPDTGEIIGPDFTRRAAHPFAGREPPSEVGTLWAQSPAIPCE